MLLQKVEKFLRQHDMAATKFGRLAAGDPRFVLDLRMGRVPRTATTERTLAWMDQYAAAQASAPARAEVSANASNRFANTPSTFETKAYSYAV